MKGQTGWEKMQETGGEGRERGEHTYEEKCGGEGVIKSGGGKGEKRVMRRRR